jgi:hypothetical protein
VQPLHSTITLYYCTFSRALASRRLPWILPGSSTALASNMLVDCLGFQQAETIALASSRLVDSLGFEQGLTFSSTPLASSRALSSATQYTRG